MKQHRLDPSGRAFALGTKAENSFVEYASTKGWKVSAATKYEDTREHIDYILTKDDVVLKVDVKSEKRVSRKDNETQTDFIWIEFCNGAGEVGWLFGKATHIAFQEGEEYLVVPREKLQERVDSLVTGSKAYRASDALYKLYTRFGRQDLLTMLKRSDIVDLHEDL